MDRKRPPRDGVQQVDVAINREPLVGDDTLGDGVSDFILFGLGVAGETIFRFGVADEMSLAILFVGELKSISRVGPPSQRSAMRNILARQCCAWRETSPATFEPKRYKRYGGD
jgi:hypothetical protein